ncbi:unnamed protein product [Symbiodinium sp. KB8]|nr:unnamed protein product [Symbiodinium sp. KB8]
MTRLDRIRFMDVQGIIYCYNYYAERADCAEEDEEEEPNDPVEEWNTIPETSKPNKKPSKPATARPKVKANAKTKAKASASKPKDKDPGADSMEMITPPAHVAGHNIYSNVYKLALNAGLSTVSNIDRDYMVADLFAGQRAISRAFRSAGLRSTALDIVIDERDDINTPLGFIRHLKAILSLRQGGLATFGVVCSSWTRVNSRSPAFKAHKHRVGQLSQMC